MSRLFLFKNYLLNFFIKKRSDNSIVCLDYRISPGAWAWQAREEPTVNLQSGFQFTTIVKYYEQHVFYSSV